MIESINVQYKIFDSQLDWTKHNSVGDVLDLIVDKEGNLFITRNRMITTIYPPGVWKIVKIEQNEENPE